MKGIEGSVISLSLLAVWWSSIPLTHQLMTSPFKPLNGHSTTASLQIYEKYCFIWFHILSHFKRTVHIIGASQAATSGKESAYQCRRYKRCGLNPWARKIPWRRKWQPIPVFLTVESHGQRSLVDCSPWGCKELNTTEHLSTSHISVYLFF